jgi:hypothetical protein
MLRNTDLQYKQVHCTALQHVAAFLPNKIQSTELAPEAIKRTKGFSNPASTFIAK